MERSEWEEVRQVTPETPQNARERRRDGARTWARTTDPTTPGVALTSLVSSLVDSAYIQFTSCTPLRRSRFRKEAAHNVIKAEAGGSDRKKQSIP